jgi:hypothetical protein
MTPEEILEVDAKRNHPPGTTVEDLITDINDELREGGDLVREGNVLIVYRAVEPGVIEYHTFNADTPENLVDAVKELFVMLKKAGGKIARTTYENEKINALFEMIKPEFKVNIKKNDGIFISEVSL